MSTASMIINSKSTRSPLIADDLLYVSRRHNDIRPYVLENMDDLVTGTKPEMEKAVSDLRFVMETLSRHIDTISQSLEGTSRNMYEFSRHIRQNPGLLLGGTPPSDNAQ